jgi:hypothetical protein
MIFTAGNPPEGQQWLQNKQEVGEGNDKDE